MSSTQSLVGQSFIQRWVTEGNKTQWFEGRITEVQKKRNQEYYKTVYEDDSVCFLTAQR